MKAKDVMTVETVGVSPQNSIRHAAGLMLDRRISGLAVLDDDGRLVGMVTEGDLLRRMELGVEAAAAAGQAPATQKATARAYVKSHAWSVADVMTTDLVEIDEDMPLNRVAALMAERGIKRCPVMRDGRLVGIVSRSDLLKAVVAATLDETVHGDDAIRRSVLTRMEETAGIGGGRVRATVRDGVVHLSGDVASQGCRDAARVTAEGVRGVEGVVDRMSVVEADGPPSER